MRSTARLVLLCVQAGQSSLAPDATTFRLLIPAMARAGQSAAAVALACEAHETGLLHHYALLDGLAYGQIMEGQVGGCGPKVLTCVILNPF